MAIDDNLYDWIQERRRRGSAKGMPPKPVPNRLEERKLQPPAQRRPIARARRIGGPGTELKKLLKKIGLAEQSSCQCNSRAQQMDAKGPQWCRDNIDTIVGWLRQEAEKRGLPFVDTGARLMVKLAIRGAERAKPPIA